MEEVPLYLKLLIAVIMLFLNGIIVLLNTSLNNCNINKFSQLAEDGNKRAKKVLMLLDKPFKYRFTNIFFKYILVILAFLLLLNLNYNVASFTIVYILIVSALFELVPRKLAISHCDKVALGLVYLESFLMILSLPIRFTLNFFVDILLKLFRQNTDIEIARYSEDKVMSMLEAGQKKGEIKEEGKRMINSIFAFDDELAYEIMTPRTDVFLIDLADPKDEYLNTLLNLKYSRIPVCENDSDNIIGILNIKDYLLKAQEDGFDNVDIKKILRKPYFVPDTKNIDSLFFEFQKEKQHIAILIDEYGGFSGIVTMEDIIEEVMGEIDDEYDQEEFSIKEINEDNYIVNGKVSLDDLYEETGIHIESENSETLGGFIIDLLGEIPKEDEKGHKLKYENYSLTILSVRERRIESVKIEILKKTDDDEK